MESINQMWTNFTQSFGNFLPQVLGALALLILGFFIAGLLKRLTRKLLSKTQLDENLAKKFKTDFRIDEFIAKLVYYIVVLYTLLIVLNMLGATSALQPLEDMLTQFVGFLPNAVAAGIIGFAGYVIANIASQASSFIAERLEVYGERAGVHAGGVDLSKIVKNLVFIFVFIPILILALDKLGLDAISGPATEMLNTFLTAIPQILAAVILLLVFYFVGKYLINIGVNLLESLGVDSLADNLNMSNLTGDRSLSAIIGNVGLFFIMFTATIAAVDKINLPEVSTILHELFNISGKVFFGLIILMGGVIISNFAVKTFGDVEKPWLTTVIRFAIMALFLAFGLHTMGIATDIVNLAFGLTLGALAVAFALAFGLGGREAAGEQTKRFFDNMNK